jgi:YD repeat-containing protein
MQLIHLERKVRFLFLFTTHTQYLGQLQPCGPTVVSLGRWTVAVPRELAAVPGCRDTGSMGRVAGEQERRPGDFSTLINTYDTNDQLLTETAPSYSETFNCDANGNQATATVGGVNQTYNVDNGDKLTSTTSGSTTLESYTYHAAGRTNTVVTSAGTTSLNYDYESRITGAGVTDPVLGDGHATYTPAVSRRATPRIDHAWRYY